MRNLMMSLKACPMYMVRFQMRITRRPTAPSMFQNQKLITRTFKNQKKKKNKIQH